MGFLTDILKEVPLSAVLKEKVATLEDKYASLETELAIKKDDLRAAQSENQKLQAEIVKLKEEIKNLSHADDLPSEKLERTLALLTAFRDSLTRRRLETSDVDESTPY